MEKQAKRERKLAEKKAKREAKTGESKNDEDGERHDDDDGQLHDEDGGEHHDDDGEHHDDEDHGDDDHDDDTNMTAMDEMMIDMFETNGDNVLNQSEVHTKKQEMLDIPWDSEHFGAKRLPVSRSGEKTTRGLNDR